MIDDVGVIFRPTRPFFTLFQAR